MSTTNEIDDTKRYEVQDNPNVLNNMILVGLVFIGLIIKLFFGFEGNANNGPATSLIWGYSIVIFSFPTIVRSTVPLLLKSFVIWLVLNIKSETFKT